MSAPSIALLIFKRIFLNKKVVD